MKNIWLVYLHRLVRIFPLMAVSILIGMTLLRFFGDGPVWPIMLDYLFGGCDQYWWSTLFFIQNYAHPVNFVSSI